MHEPPDKPTPSDHHRHRAALGAAGELAVREQLERNGWQIVATNMRCGRGEIDIVAKELSTLVICEVKTLRASVGSTISPFESVDWKKRRSMRRTTAAWLSGKAAHDGSGREIERPSGASELRFDVFAVWLDQRTGRSEIEHIRGAL